MKEGSGAKVRHVELSLFRVKLSVRKPTWGMVYEEIGATSILYRGSSSAQAEYRP